MAIVEENRYIRKKGTTKKKRGTFYIFPLISCNQNKSLARSYIFYGIQRISELCFCFLFFVFPNYNSNPGVFLSVQSTLLDETRHRLYALSGTARKTKVS